MTAREIESVLWGAAGFTGSLVARHLLDSCLVAIWSRQLPLPTVSVVEEASALGYAASKWAGEHMLRLVHRDSGVPVNTLRGNMMFPHQKYPGQINDTDMFSRWMYSVTATGLAPEWFYVPAEDGGKSN